jgi:hypothetical protein
LDAIVSKIAVEQASFFLHSRVSLLFFFLKLQICLLLVFSNALQFSICLRIAPTSCHLGSLGGAAFAVAPTAHVTTCAPLAVRVLVLCALLDCRVVLHMATPRVFRYDVGLHRVFFSTAALLLLLECCTQLCLLFRQPLFRQPLLSFEAFLDHLQKMLE